MSNIYEYREHFGQLLSKLRHEAGLSLRELGAATGIPYSLICSMEHGERAVNADTAVRLADGLGLHGRDKTAFLLKGAATRRKDKLVSFCRSLPAELLNYVPMQLRETGINLEAIKSCRLKPAGDAGELLEIALEDGRTITCGIKVTTV